jgi:hypothetical protein
MPAEPFFFGCPVLEQFIRTTEPVVDWNLYDSEEWAEIKARVQSERPTGGVVLRRAILCVAFSFEEIGFSLKKLRHHDSASSLRSMHGPIRGPEDLQRFVPLLNEVTEDVISRLVNDRMTSEELGPKQVTAAVRENLRTASNVIHSCIKRLQENWAQPQHLGPCGADLAIVLETLKVAFDRRLAYFKTLQEKAVHDG